MNLLIAGDYCPNNRIGKRFDCGDYGCFDTIKTAFDNSDYSVVNLECPVIEQSFDPIEKTGPNLGCSGNGIEALKYVGVDCVTLANNHFFDYGSSGVEKTISTLNRNNIEYVGGGRDLPEAYRILYKEINKEKFSIINCCEKEFSVVSEEHGGSNPLDIINIHNDIITAKKESQYVIVIVHGGIEHYNLPTPRMQKVYRFFVESGADVIVNHHQHCYSGYEIYHNKPIFYGLGNFCFDYTSKKHLDGWTYGFLLRLNIHNGSIDYNLIPYKIVLSTNCLVELLYGDSSTQFFDKVYSLNAIISDSTKLLHCYNQLLIQTRRKYLFNVEPYRTRLSKFLYKYNLLPSFVDKNLLLNIVRCESHVERLIDALKN